MKSIALATIFLLLMVSCSSCAGRQYPHQAPTMMDVSVVKITSVDKDGEVVGRCTAWKLDENRMVTAGHCCSYETEDGTALQILLGEAKVTKHEVPMFTMEGSHALAGTTATVLKQDEKHDICILKGKMRGAPVALAAHDPVIGDRVFTAGYPHTTYLISDGIWSGRDDDGQGIASVAVWGGASGSPLLDSDGRVIGVVVAYWNNFDSLTFVAPLEWLRVNATLSKLLK